MRDIAHFLGVAESHDARERNIEAEVERRLGKLPSRRKTMQNARKPAVFSLFGEDRGGVLVGVAGMDDQRQAGFARRRDMGAEIGALVFARAAVVIVIEPGLADAHHLGQGRPLCEARGGGDPLFRDLMRMNAHRAPDGRMRARDGVDGLETAEMGTDGDHGADAGRVGAGDDLVAIVVEYIEIEMAVAVDQHRGFTLRRSAGTRDWAREAPFRASAPSHQKPQNYHSKH